MSFLKFKQVYQSLKQEQKNQSTLEPFWQHSRLWFSRENPWKRS